MFFFQIFLGVKKRKCWQSGLFKIYHKEKENVLKTRTVVIKSKLYDLDNFSAQYSSLDSAHEAVKNLRDPVGRSIVRAGTFRNRAEQGTAVPRGNYTICNFVDMSRRKMDGTLP